MFGYCIHFYASICKYYFNLGLENEGLYFFSYLLLIYLTNYCNQTIILHDLEISFFIKKIKNKKRNKFFNCCLLRGSLYFLLLRWCFWMFFEFSRYSIFMILCLGFLIEKITNFYFIFYRFSVKSHAGLLWIYFYPVYDLIRLT